MQNYGFTPVTLSGKSLKEQAKIFDNAKIICAPHGAALANLIYAKPETKVIELTNTAYTARYFEHLARKLDLHFIQLESSLEIPESKKVKFPVGNSYLDLDFVVDINKLKCILKKIGLLENN